MAFIASYITLISSFASSILAHVCCFSQLLQTILQNLLERCSRVGRFKFVEVFWVHVVIEGFNLPWSVVPDVLTCDQSAILNSNLNLCCSSPLYYRKPSWYPEPCSSSSACMLFLWRIPWVKSDILYDIDSLEIVPEEYLGCVVLFFRCHNILCWFISFVVAFQVGH